VKTAKIITHLRQEKPYSCGAACIAMLFNKSESVIRKEIKTDSGGTNTYDVCDFLKRNNLIYYRISINQSYGDSIQNLINTSYKFPLYICGEFRDRFHVKGRDNLRHHAILIVDGHVYDPAEPREMSGEAYEKVFNKALVFNDIIIIENERPNFIKNFSELI